MNAETRALFQTLSKNTVDFPVAWLNGVKAEYVRQQSLYGADKARAYINDQIAIKATGKIGHSFGTR
jgi:hypothetical protein